MPKERGGWGTFYLLSSGSLPTDRTGGPSSFLPPTNFSLDSDKHLLLSGTLYSRSPRVDAFQTP